MKKLIYIFFVGVASFVLSSCSGQEEYDAYVANLKEQPAAIEAITTPAEYAEYLDQLAVEADSFDQLGLKLTSSQKEELLSLSDAIQKALTDKYNALAATPVTLPDSIPVLDAEVPVEDITNPNATPALQ